MSTLIIRDATLAVNGAQESRDDPGEHLDGRIAEVQQMTSTDVVSCFEVLESAANSAEEVDLDVLQALTVISIAHPAAAEERGVSALASGRRYAARLERTGDPDGALAVIERLREHFPSHQALERDYDAVLGRLGMVMDLAERYHDRAQFLLREGKNEEAIGWLREVLLLDASRTDVARKIRDLRLDSTREHRVTRTSKAPMLGALLIGIGLSLGVVRERNLLADFEELPTAMAEDYASKRFRLEALETFITEHPIWHGAIGAVAERSELRIEVDQLGLLEAELQEERALELQDRLESAELARLQARSRVGSQDYLEALDLLEKALELGPPDWDQRERVERDIVAILEYMAELNSTRNSE